MSGVTDRPGVSFDSNHVLLPTQPFVKCFINNVEVYALIDTGSMRTFISNRIHNIIDFDSKLIDSTVAEHCVSITGGSLNILGHLSANVKFAKSKTAYKAGTAEDLLIGGAMRIFNHCRYAISLEIDCFYALLTRQICA